MNEKKQYKVLKPIGFSGRREAGEIIALSEEEAKNIGLDYLEEVKAGETVAPVEEPRSEGEYTPDDEEEILSEEEAKNKNKKKKGKK